MCLNSLPKYLGLDTWGYLLPPWAQASFSFHIVLTQFSSICYSHNPNVAKFKEKSLASLSTASLPASLTTPAPSKAPLFQGAQASRSPLSFFEKLLVVFSQFRAHCEFYFTGTFPMSLHFPQALSGSMIGPAFHYGISRHQCSGKNVMVLSRPQKSYRNRPVLSQSSRNIQGYVT